jgi:hypothetical protein
MIVWVPIRTQLMDGRYFKISCTSSYKKWANSSLNMYIYVLQFLVSTTYIISVDICRRWWVIISIGVFRSSVNLWTLILNSVDLRTFSVHQVSTLMNNCFIVFRYLLKRLLAYATLHRERHIQVTVEEPWSII